ADKPIVTLTNKDLLAAWNGLRHTCMLQSNRLSPETKAFLTKQGEWWNLKLEDLVRLGLTGKTLARAHAAGLSATEQTMGNASRAVARAIKAERIAAANTGRQQALVHNPFEALADDERYRSSRELAKHYADSKVRNPLGTDDSATGSQTLPTVLKALVGRRDMQNGH